MTRLLNIIILLLAVTLVAVILYPQLQENRPTVVRFACDSSVSALPILVAVDESLLQANRIIPELRFYSDPDQALAQLFAGEVDVGVFPYGALFRRMQEHGETLRVFMSEDYRQSLPVDAIVVPAGSRIRSIQELKSRRLGYPPQIKGYLQVLLLNLNLTSEQVTLVEVPLSMLREQLDSAKIDAAWLIEPQLCGLDTTRYRLLQPAALARYVSAPFPGAAIGFADEFLGRRRVLLSRLKIATDAAAALIETSPERAKRIVGAYFPYCSEVCGVCRLPEVERLVEINKPAVAGLAARMHISGSLPAEVETREIFVEPIRLTR